MASVSPQGAEGEAGLLQKRRHIPLQLFEIHGEGDAAAESGGKLHHRVGAAVPAVDGQIPGSQEDGGAVFHVPADAPPVTVVNFQNGVGGGVAKGDLTRKKIVEGEADAREELPDLHEALA